MYTPTGLPITFAIANTKADEHEVLRGLVEIKPDLLRPDQVILADKGYASAPFESFLAKRGFALIRPAKAGEPTRPGSPFLKPLRRVIESTNETVPGRLDLERHGGHTQGGVVTHVIQRRLAMTAAIWHNNHCRVAPVRSLIATTTVAPPWNWSHSAEAAAHQDASRVDDGLDLFR